MATYCIMVDDGVLPVEPYEIELADLQAARLEAARLLGALLEHEPNSIWQSKAWQVTVQREGLALFVLHAFVVEAPAAGCVLK